MIDTTALQRDALVQLLDDLYGRVWGSRDPEVPEVVAWAVETALDPISRSDALYHDVEHTVLVTLVGARMLVGRHTLEGGTTPDDWLHVMLALLFHDVGYVRGVVRGDRPGAWLTGLDEQTVSLAPGATDAALQPWHVDRGIKLIRDRFGSHARLRADVLADYIDYTRIPVPPGAAYAETRSLRALVRAADLIGQLADRRYLQKLPGLYQEFREIGLDKTKGYANADDLRDDFPAFYELTVRPLVGDALGWLSATAEGRQTVASLHDNLARART